MVEKREEQAGERFDMNHMHTFLSTGEGRGRGRGRTEAPGTAYASRGEERAEEAPVPAEEGAGQGRLRGEEARRRQRLG
jgi:hypothetical protein